MPGIPAEIEEEIDVLRAIYGDDAVITDEASGGKTADLVASFLVRLTPRVEQGGARSSVEFSVKLPVGYPSSAAPLIGVERSRGLSDAAIGSILAAVRKAIEEFGLQDIGCISEVLSEASDALDAANDESECNICLAPCGSDQSVTTTRCDHVFHSSCLARWLTLKAAEAEEQASEKSASSRAERDAVQAQLAEAAVALGEAGERLERCRRRQEMVSQCAAHMRTKAEGREDAVDAGVAADALIEELQLHTFNMYGAPEPPSLEHVQEQVRKAKADEKSAVSEEKRAVSRKADVEKRLQTLQQQLAVEKAKREAASLPCPVCLSPIEAALLPAALSSQELGKAEQADEKSASRGTSLAELPAAVREHARKVQESQNEILARRAAKQAEEEALEKERQENAQVTAAAVEAVAPADDARGGDSGGSTQTSNNPETSRQSRAGKANQGREKNSDRHGAGAASWKNGQSWDQSADSGWGNGWDADWQQGWNQGYYSETKSKGNGSSGKTGGKAQGKGKSKDGHERGDTVRVNRWAKR
eukprot:TRINITY_DN50677_c1_g2_i1.p1 TRINITY_DN50677_c1_g2~~TRINITY_DN50677_c1_g2_i1.p1  ORF type:complete len:533 (+),score=131.97 TRINITY_DN50677_c1_g2_i1:89-1687(+)